jgi:hypothetical protein
MTWIMPLEALRSGVATLASLTRIPSLDRDLHRHFSKGSHLTGL